MPGLGSGGFGKGGFGNGGFNSRGFGNPAVVLKPAPTYTDQGGGSLSGANSTAHAFTVTAGDTFVYLLTGFFDSTGIGLLSIDGGANLPPTCSIASAASGGSNQGFAAIWVVTGLAAGAHNMAWNGAAATLDSFGTISGNAATVTNVTAASPAGGATLTGNGSTTKKTLLLVACMARSLSAGAPSSADAGSTTIRNNVNTPGPAIHWQETLNTPGAVTVTANIQTGKPQALAAVAIAN